jgi:hypothetical protein
MAVKRGYLIFFIVFLFFLMPLQHELHWVFLAGKYLALAVVDLQQMPVPVAGAFRHSLTAR